jgi:hypothetical protein
MEHILKNIRINAFVLFKSKFGVHAVRQDFEPDQIIPQSIDDLTDLEILNRSAKREVALINLLDMEDEYGYIEMILNKKLTKKLIGSNQDYLELIDSAGFRSEKNEISVVLAINVCEFSDEYFDVVDGDRTTDIEENLKGWIGSGIWLEGLNSVSKLMDYFTTIDELPMAIIGRQIAEKRAINNDPSLR